MSNLKCIRLSMEVYVISDLETRNGLSIQKDMVAACTPEAEGQSQYKCPQERPTASDWRLWAAKLQDITSAKYSLRRQLGRWIREPHKIWQWRYNAERNLFVKNAGEKWYEYALVHSCPHRYGKNYTLSSLQERFPSVTQFATVVRMCRGIVQLTGSAGMRSVIDRPTNQRKLK